MNRDRLLPEDSPEARAVNLRGFACLLVVYVVWGSTYLAIRIAVREGSGYPPFILGATRTLAAGLLLVAWGVFRHRRILPSPGEWRTLVLSGLLLWVGGNGLVNWAEQHADSGLAALLVGTMPIWVALFEAALDRRRPSLRLIGALLVGFAGLAVLTWPQFTGGKSSGVLAILALLAAPVSWGAGSVLMARRPVRLSPGVSSGLQQLIGAAGFFLISFLVREPSMHPTREAWLAWGYLVVAGSIIAFTSFLMTLRLLPTTLVMTYAYVNPVIAVFLGWLVLSEAITLYTAGGTLLILLGVAGVFEEKRRWT